MAKNPAVDLVHLVARLREEGLGFGIGPALLCQEAAATIEKMMHEDAEWIETSRKQALDNNELRATIERLTRERDEETQAIERVRAAHDKIKQELEALRYSNELRDEIAQARTALERMDARKNEDVQEWADELGKTFGAFRD